MKKIILMIFVLIMFSSIVYAQQVTGMTSAQIRQEAQQFLTQSRANSAEFERILNEFRARSLGNYDAVVFARLRSEILNLETLINAEEDRLRMTLDRGVNISGILVDRIDVLISRHRARLEELEAFIAN